MATEDYHLLPHIAGWAIKREGAPSPMSIHPTKDEALMTGRRLAKANRGKLLVHGRRGIIEDEGDDLPPSR